VKKNDINVNRQMRLALRVGFGCLYLYLFFAPLYLHLYHLFCAVGFEILTFVNVFLCGWLWLLPFFYPFFCALGFGFSFPPFVLHFTFLTFFLLVYKCELLFTDVNFSAYRG